MLDSTDRDSGVGKMDRVDLLCDKPLTAHHWQLRQCPDLPQVRGSAKA